MQTLVKEYARSLVGSRVQGRLDSAQRCSPEAGTRQEWCCCAGWLEMGGEGAMTPPTRRGGVGGSCILTPASLQRTDV